MTSEFKNKKVLIMGLGSYRDGSGISAALFFAHAGADVLVNDIGPATAFTAQIKRLKKYRNVRFLFGKHRKTDFQTADYIIKNPAVPKNHPMLGAARKSGVPIHNDWSIFLSLKDNPVIGVTGTRGKTTVATLLNEFLKEHYATLLCGNMGLSPLAIINTVKRDDVIVAELSSWNLQQLPTIKKSPHIAVVTNLLTDHLNKYKNLNEYYKDKERIFAYQKKDDFLVANRDNAELRKRARTARSRAFLFSKKPFSGNGAHIKNGRIVFRYGKAVMDVCGVKDIRLPGEHNLENALAAVCAAFIAHVSPRHIKKTLKAFTGVPNRLELVREVSGVTYYNDTTATTPDATIAALRALKSKNIILLAGGTDKKLNFKAWSKEIKKWRPRIIFFSGTAMDKMQKELKKYPHILGTVSSMKEAMRLAKQRARKGDIVLLSPGAASFGIFKNEFDRGTQFVKAVKKL
ncbi:UDP-N-acetylmuramoylalanine--D-glutamate ligase [Candidatus Azambacteria bacterium RIFCSPHIGHO2_02_FULL_52_12]|uniref:UDP-N-acetylmuramoylalanine--D-glutamate ligase n=1 Tax=Candidatus Azambacteria bacterium RIFCSPLOWO2_01_FULL_46_25 TaxID=1797298 RepID=A0A1F5BV22_9BACT|nr:MAG: UDP-N-acetylmuramoylalanine--D-glutamate ligase [Candidatus Azambacteria bacterium RIFCSPHIGHO2_02_FULL_52_12]OGD34450.1 MAG: UDP-N-acetylmuramoylalanine--D-glutamate ligase [Candidatus Azambacteria bacterium RIFCSPLOWO2_01_FULL_46_25]OGD37272.1 MAG: UDP-N-acetylmuramoylalanine--D-glutamate ligase [Candidatus Azambacteria bacterium RIFCSPHIGHO2_01_FULL_51_74]